MAIEHNKIRAADLEPIPSDWAWLDALVGPVDEDFRRAVAEPPPPEEREVFDG